MNKFTISIQDESPSYGDARNPSVPVMQMTVMCTKEDVVKLLAACRKLYPTSHSISLCLIVEVGTTLKYDGVGYGTVPFPKDLSEIKFN